MLILPLREGLQSVPNLPPTPRQRGSWGGLGGGVLPPSFATALLCLLNLHGLFIPELCPLYKHHRHFLSSPTSQPSALTHWGHHPLGSPETSPSQKLLCSVLHLVGQEDHLETSTMSPPHLFKYLTKHPKSRAWPGIPNGPPLPAWQGPSPCDPSPQEPPDPLPRPQAPSHLGSLCLRSACLHFAYLWDNFPLNYSLLLVMTPSWGFRRQMGRPLMCLDGFVGENYGIRSHFIRKHILIIRGFS